MLISSLADSTLRFFMRESVIPGCGFGSNCATVLWP